MPFDILAGDSRLREVLTEGLSLAEETERWEAQTETYLSEFRQMALYTE
jgi:hypothetical protein